MNCDVNITGNNVVVVVVVVVAAAAAAAVVVVVVVILVLVLVFIFIILNYSRLLVIRLQSSGKSRSQQEIGEFTPALYE
jgi:Flp pilus assembly protein TadB